MSPSIFGSVFSPTPSVTTEFPAIGHTGVQNPVPTLFSNMEPLVLNTETLPSPGLDLGVAKDFMWLADSPTTSSSFRLESNVHISGAAPRQVQDVVLHTEPLSSFPRKRKKSLTSSQDAHELMVKSLSQNILCEDFYDILESELPRWTCDGLWQESPLHLAEHNLTMTTTARGILSPPLTSYSKLEQTYLAVCQMNSRMGGDLVRSRVALIRLHLEYTEIQQGRGSTSASNRVESTVGRGYASHAIDHILNNVHEGWNTFDQRRRAELRAKFHDRNKYGKRWSQLANALGSGILLICSTKLASAVYAFSEFNIYR